MHGLEAEYGNCIEFVYLDIDDSATADARKQYQFLAQPLIVLMDGQGKELWRKIGRVDRQTLERQLQTALETTP